MNFAGDRYFVPPPGTAAWASGDTAGWRATYDRLAPDLADSWRDVLLYTMMICTGDLPGVIELYEKNPSAPVPGSGGYGLGVTYTALGDAPHARPHLLAAAAAGRESAVDDIKAESAVALALLGEHAAALAADDEAVPLLLEARDVEVQA
jgi:hypothetical protein